MREFLRAVIPPSPTRERLEKLLDEEAQKKAQPNPTSRSS
jgi:hypothetical protein